MRPSTEGFRNCSKHELLEESLTRRADGGGGTAENPEEMLAALLDATLHDVTADTVAAGLVETAGENGGFLIIGASRTRLLRQWVFGSTPDRVIELAERRDVPVVVYASSTGVSGRLEDAVFPAVRYVRKHLA